ncbi:hypothetical protein [Streptomyces sp. NPDC002671]
MPVQHSAALCGIPDQSARLTGADAAVIVVVVVVASAQAAHGMPTAQIIPQLGPIGLLAVALARLSVGAGIRSLRLIARAQPALLLR